jgi:hypothetical protein
MPKCPSQRRKLGSFALINIVIFCVTLVLGRCSVVHFLTCRHCGKPEGSALWLLVALFFVGLGIAANFANALIVRASPGFEGVSVVDLVLLWCSRPRIAWVAAWLVFIGKEESIYFSTGASALVAEVVLQVMGAVYLGRSVNFATIRHYYYYGHINGVVVSGKNAALMYIGALLWIVAIGAALFQIVYSFLGLRELIVRAWNLIKNGPKETTRRWQDHNRAGMRARISTRLPAWIERSRRLIRERIHVLRAPIPAVRPIDQPTENQSTIDCKAPVAFLTWGITWQRVLAKMGLSEDALKRMAYVVFCMVPPFIGQWLFWAGFVPLADEL